MAIKRLKGMDKAAIFLSNLGEDLASEVIKFLNPTDIQMIGRRITSIQNIDSETFFEVMDEFKQHCASIETDVYDNLGAANVASKYVTEGAAGPKQAKEQIAYWTGELSQR